MGGADTYIWSIGVQEPVCLYLFLTKNIFRKKNVTRIIKALDEK